jgi:hypothetical protein
VALDTLATKELERERKAHDSDDYPLHLDLYGNAVLLQIGVNDPAKIVVDRITM